ncbi:MAG TPA: FAD-dependent oxidoreductase, partial [Bacteroidota bacterium]|nr:FAD-dependent oxidoreductase [Bacteroidota bacterium]
LKNTATGETSRLETDYLLPNFGFHPREEPPFKKWGLEVKGEEISVDENMETSIKGIYAAGDASTYPGKGKTIGAGFREVEIAVNAIDESNPK